MSSSRYQTQAAIRRVLARHWVDLDRIRVGEFRGVVRLTGELRFAEARSDRPSIGLLEALRSEIRRMAGVRTVAFEFENFRRSADGSWVEVDDRVSGETVEGAGRVFEMVNDNPEEGA